ncbi:MAG: nucleoside diphosphate kinase regulator [Papillibacter sp.]|nr:nucleoside diphosphate kinase regulator [Papillibacter sp.]
MKDPFIFLCSEITRDNALTLISWLRDEEVRRYLSESQNVTQELRQLIERVNLPVLTHLFNQNGRFYMAYNRQDRPVGYVRLIKQGAADYEIVIVIGDRDNWNKKLGKAVIREAVKTAFFEFRAEKITAKIHCDNKRSIRAFLSCGFRPERETAQLKVYTLTIEQYLKRLKGETFMSSEIYITKLDRDRIKGILDKLYESSTKPDNNIKKLQGELNRAIVVEPQEVSGDVITMNSRALLQLDEQDMEVSLVYPEEADLADMKLSVFSPIGTAILGYKEGSSIKWEVPSGTSMIHIKKVIYQPEAAGDYHL